MKWLAVKYKQEDVLFIQERKVRENQNNALITNKAIIETIVIKSFDTEESAKEYCEKINIISKLIHSCLNTE